MGTIRLPVEKRTFRIGNKKVRVPPYMKFDSKHSAKQFAKFLKKEKGYAITRILPRGKWHILYAKRRTN